MLFSIFKWVGIAVLFVSLALLGMFVLSSVLITRHGGA
jgi:hypothetical protein